MKPKRVVAASMPQWISVDKQFPNPGDIVLIYAPEYGVCLDLYNGFEFSMYDITHWMLLPEGPGEVGA